MKKFVHFKITFMIFGLFLLFAQDAYAYLDPGTGSYIFQVAVATILGGLFALKSAWGNVKAYWTNLFSKKPNNKKDGL